MNTKLSSAIASMLIGTLSVPAAATQLARSLSADEVGPVPTEVRFLIYADQLAMSPLAVADFGTGQFRIEEQGGQVRLSAELQQDLDTEELWVETELDGKLTGERVELAISAPGVTFALGNHLDMDGNFIANLATPEEPGDAATKAYVDTVNTSGTAAALAQDGSNCTSGYPAGVDEYGNAQDCTADATDDTVQLSELSELCQVEGQILKYSGGAWGCATDAVGAGDNLGDHTATQNIDLGDNWLSGDGDSEGIRVDATGKVGIDAAPGSANLIVGGVDGILATGTLNEGTIPMEGVGTRMMWYPGKGAFRAGYLNNPVYWEDANIGLNSVAMGQNTMAKGVASVALGDGSDAIGDQSIALGLSATATGSNAVAIGALSDAVAPYSKALGFSVKAFSTAEIALGSMNTFYTPASPDGWNESDRMFVIGNGHPSKGKSDAMVILKNGNVGLGGNATPADTLDVTGTINATDAIKVNGVDLLSSVMQQLEEIYTLQQSTDAKTQIVFDAVSKTESEVQCGREFIGLRTDGTLGILIGKNFEIGDGTVVDQCVRDGGTSLSGLVWLRDANCFGRVTWDEAANLIGNLEDGVCGLSDGSVKGEWRFPTPEEWEALFNTNYSNPALSNSTGDGQWSYGNPYINVQHPGLDPSDNTLGWYWSTESEEYPLNSEPCEPGIDCLFANYVHVGSGATGSTFYIEKTNLMYVWPVRAVRR